MKRCKLTLRRRRRRRSSSSDSNNDHCHTTLKGLLADLGKSPKGLSF
jgi:hypothetical protein